MIPTGNEQTWLEGHSPADDWDAHATKRVLDELFCFARQYRTSKSFAGLLKFVVGLPCKWAQERSREPASATALQGFEFGDGNLGAFWVESQPQRGSTGRASENERLLTRCSAYLQWGATSRWAVKSHTVTCLVRKRIR
jgi:hypothetical protein